MKLRIARKILKTIGTPREFAYTQFQFDRAFACLAKTETERKSNRFWNACMAEISLERRVEMVRKGEPGLAFKALMDDSMRNRDRIVKVRSTISSECN